MRYNHVFIVASKEDMLEAIIKFEDGRRIIVKDDAGYPTQNRKEAYLIVKALSMFKPGFKIIVHCYSNYVPNSLQAQWIERWESNGWKTQNNEIVKNQDLLKKLVLLSEILNIILLEPFNHFHYVDLLDKYVKGGKEKCSIAKQDNKNRY